MSQEDAQKDLRPESETEVRPVWKIVDSNKPWVAFDFEQTLGILMKKEEILDLELAKNNLKSQGIRWWEVRAGDYIVALRYHTEEVLNNVGKDFNVVMLTSMNGYLAKDVVQANRDFARKYCFVGGRSGNVDNPYYLQNVSGKYEDGSEKHPDHIISQNTKILVDDSPGMYEGMWKGDNNYLIQVKKINSLTDDELLSIPDRVRSIAGIEQQDEL